MTAVEGRSMEVARADIHSNPRCAPEARNPNAAAIVSGDPNIARSRARRHIGHRRANNDPNSGLRLSGAQSQGTGYQRCTKNDLLQHALHNSSVPAGSIVRKPPRLFRALKLGSCCFSAPPVMPD